MAPSRAKAPARAPPTAGPRPGSGNPAPTVASADAFNKFREQLKLAAKKNGKEIKISENILDPVNEPLRTRRGIDTPFQSTIVTGIISDLDDEGDDICSRLEVSVYKTLLQLFLQTTNCPEVERGIYLLAAALYQDEHLTAKESLVEARKTAIGEDTLESLLKFFTNTRNPTTFRRWVGILLIQLLYESEKNIERIEWAPENSRRTLGTMVVTGSDEILKIICGQLIKVLVDGNVPLEDLWPADANEEVYQGFPDSSQLGSWNQHFQSYLDKVDKSGNQGVYLYFPQEVETEPSYDMERRGHTTYAVMDSKTLTIWSPASDTQFDQFFEIPLEHIVGMTISTPDESQMPTGVAKVELEFDNDDEQLCFLNAVRVDLNTVLMVLHPEDAIGFGEDLSEYRPDLAPQEASRGTQELESQKSVRSSSSNEAIVQEGSRRSVRFESGDRRSGKGRVEASKEVRQAVDVEFGLPPQSSMPEILSEGDGFSKLCHTQAKANNITSQPALTGQEREVDKQKQRAGNARSRTSVEPATKAGSKKTKPKPKAANVASKSSQSSETSGPNLQEKVEKLSQAFPAVSNPTLRGALVNHGNIGDATETLGKGIQSDNSSDEQRQSEARGGSSSHKPDEHFDSASFTSLDGNDVSTPRFNKSTTSQKATSKPAANTNQSNKTLISEKSKTIPKYSVKSKPPLGSAKSTVPSAKSHEKPTVANIASAKSQVQQKATNKISKSHDKMKVPAMPAVKGNVNSRVAGSDPYEIVAEEDDAKESAALKKGAKGNVKAKSKALAKKAPAAAKTAPKAAKNGPKKRQSAPAALGTTAAATRSRRSAAVVASQKLRDSNPSDDEIKDVVGLVDTENSQKSRSGNGTASQNNPKIVAKMREEKVVPALSPDNQDISIDGGVDLGPLDDAQDPEPDLYDASPKQPAKKSTQEPVRQRTQILTGPSKPASQSLQNFPSKLEDILGDIDDGLSPDNDKDSDDNLNDKPLTGTLQKHKSGPPYDAREKKKSSDLMGNSHITGSAQADVGKSEEIKLKKKVRKADGPRDPVDNYNADVHHPEPSRRRPPPRRPSVQDESTPLARESINDVGAELLQTRVTDTELTLAEQYSSADEAVINDRKVQGTETDANEAVTNDFTQTIPLIANKVASGSIKKRKITADIETPCKRRRSQGDATQVNKNQSPRRSPRLNTKVEEKQKNDKQQSRKAVPKPTSPPARPSPRLEARKKTIPEVTEDMIFDKPLIDDHLTRKVQIVNFGVHGANNQGRSSVLRSSTKADRTRAFEQPAAEAGSAVLRNSKRAREDLNNSNTASQMGPPSKHHSISPEECHNEVELDGGIPLEYSSSPPLRPSKKLRSTKSSSQASRVDQNGSPRPLVSVEEIDHISRVTQKLLQQDDGVQALNSNMIFAGRVRLASIPKTGPSSPNGVEARYVKHQKMGNGVYQGFGTREVVASEKSLADPFVGSQARRSSDFTERLQAGSSKENRTSNVALQPTKSTQVLVDSMKPNVVKPSTYPTAQATKQERKSRKSQKDDRMQVYDDQTTLVDSEPELTGGSSEEDMTTPLREKKRSNAWNMAIRPHYGNLSEVAHRLADEVILRLTGEEDVMGHIVQQYKDNGGKHLDLMIESRKKEKAQIADNLNHQKKEMVAVYGDAKAFVHDSEKALKSSVLGKFEKQWRKDQERIQRAIDEGRRVLQ